MPIDFHPLSVADSHDVQRAVRSTDFRNCDLNIVNLVGWRFHYGTETAIHDGSLLFRFRVNGHLAYMAPLTTADWAPALRAMLDDADRQGHPFLMLGVCENSLEKLEAAMPGYFYANCERDYADYVYERTKLETLSGKKLQSKRNYVNRFAANFPQWNASPLTEADIPQCIELEQKWETRKRDMAPDELSALEEERRAMLTVFDHWNELPVTGCVLRVGEQIVAFTYGGPVNHDTFDVCVEKADTAFEGSFAMINREFVRILPQQYVYVNREEDLGMEGLRRAKLSYHPFQLLHKYSVMTKHPLGA